MCPGVSLSTARCSPNAPRVALLLYADDFVILAEDAGQLQRALDAIEAWSSQWRFSFGIGTEKSAVGSRSIDYRFMLPGSLLPCVRQYTYLGVTFEASRKWRKHAARLMDTGNHRFHQFLGWAENRQLHTGFRSQLFQTYVLPAILYGAHFLDSGQLARLDQKLRQWGRRLLHWPSGAPHAAVLGELGWLPFVFEVQRLQFGLFGRLATADAFGARRSLAARVFQLCFAAPGFVGAWCFARIAGCWYTAPPFMELGAWRGCKAGSALESACRATGDSASCSLAVLCGIDGNAVPRRLCCVSACVCTVATTFIPRGSRRPCFGSGR